ncbi:MAG: DMT family transporter [Cognatishimia sp.]|uniref:DMT family transporter n=1 Tax=Cognatishimia sp. TaxID=2211648 RepID=UPI003B8CF946
MTVFLLFTATVLIWGSSWIAIAFQLGDVPVLVSIFYRFALAAIVMIAGLVLLGRLKLPSVWRFVALQALCLFSFNFICFYNATGLIPSGLVSVVFSLASIFNAVNARVIYKEQISPRVIIAGLIGVSGLVLLFWNELFARFDMDSLRGVAWACGGTMLFSLGNMVSRKNTSVGVSPIIANAWGMGIGAIVLLALILVSSTPVVAPIGVTYWTALAYLSVIGSVVGFSTYLLLVQNVGSAKAGYATVVFPLIALLLSTLFEGYVWTETAFVGVALIVVGNLVMFTKPRRLKRSCAPA